MVGIKLLLGILAIIITPQLAFADTQDELDFASALEETHGHLWALERNLDEGNDDLALIHATHPIAELYDSMKPTLTAADPSLDERLFSVLSGLGDSTGTGATREQAQDAIEEARGVVEQARSTVVGDELSGDPDFKMRLVRILLETSTAEYYEAVSGGEIVNPAEYQDGLAFVVRSQMIFDGLKSEIDSHEADEIDELYGELLAAYDALDDPTNVEPVADHIISELNGILGDTDGDADLLEYVETINMLLADAKTEYRGGNADLALSLVTKAYLDNYEFLEQPLIDAGERELMEEIEIQMREELREMIRSGAPASEVDSQIDLILAQMNTVAAIVPEFGTVAVLILAAATISILALTARSRLVLIRP